MNSAVHRFIEKVETTSTTDCWLWLGAVGSDGYGRVKHRQVVHSAHRFSYELFKGPIPEDLCVLHRCDTPLCVNPTHLALGTKEDNSRDMLRKGRAGESHAKLTRAEVDEIRSLLEQGVSKLEVADRFGVCRSTVQDIGAAATWTRREHPGQGRLFEEL